MPLVGIRTNRGDHLGKICLGVRKAHVTRATRDIVENKGLVPVIQKGKRHRILLMRGDVRKRASAADDHCRATTIGLAGQRFGPHIGKRRRIFLGRLLAPQRMALDNHACSLRAIRAHVMYRLQAYPTRTHGIETYPQ